MIISCTKDNPTNTNEDDDNKELSSEKNIISFKFSTASGDVYPAEIRNDSVFATFPATAPVNHLYAEITLSDKASITPDPSYPQNYTSIFTYTITAEDGSKKEYKVVTSKLPSAAQEIKAFQFSNIDTYHSPSFISQNGKRDTLVFTLPARTDLTKLTSNIELSEGASIEPKSGTTLDYTQPVLYKVTAQDLKTTREYVVIVKRTPLKQLRLETIFADMHRNRKPNETIYFKAEELPVQDSIKVKLISRNKKYEYTLNIQNVDYEENKVTISLPESYLNNSYYLDVSVGKNNKDESSYFNLDGGTSLFENVTNYFSSNNTPFTTLLFPSEKFEIKAFVNKENFSKNQFFIRKNGIEFALENTEFYAGELINLAMPSSIPTNITSGRDFELVIKYEGKTYAYPLTNSIGERINVIVPKKAEVTSLSKYTFAQGDKITIYGKNLYYPFHQASNSNVNERAYLFLSTSSKITYNNHHIPVKKSDLNPDGSVTVTITDEVISGSEYDVRYINNVPATEIAPTNLKATVILPNSEHPSVKVISAIAYSEKSSHFAKQLAVKFNTEVANLNIKKIVFPWPHEFSNFVTYTDLIMTSQLTDLQYTDVYTRKYDGYVLIEENGKQYKLYFSVERQ